MSKGCVPLNRLDISEQVSKVTAMFSVYSIVLTLMKRRLLSRCFMVTWVGHVYALSMIHIWVVWPRREWRCEGQWCFSTAPWLDSKVLTGPLKTNLMAERERKPGVRKVHSFETCIHTLSIKLHCVLWLIHSFSSKHLLVFVSQWRGLLHFQTFMIVNKKSIISEKVLCQFSDISEADWQVEKQQT